MDKGRIYSIVVYQYLSKCLAVAVKYLRISDLRIMNRRLTVLVALIAAAGLFDNVVG